MAAHGTKKTSATKPKTQSDPGTKPGANPEATDPTAEAQDTQSGDTPQIDPKMIKQIAELRAALRQSYAQVVMAMSQMPRYKTQMLSDLNQLVLDPMLRDRLTTAYKPAPEGSDMEPDVAGFAIWASVSEEVDASIRSQIKGGVFPVKLKPGDWVSGEINWLLDVISPDPKMTASVVANFSRVANKGREVHLHPLVSRMVDPKVLEQLGARRGPRPDAQAGAQTEPAVAQEAEPAAET